MSIHTECPMPPEPSMPMDSHTHPDRPGRDPPRHKVRHSRSGCATCRRRRVRCDERKDVCGNCERLQLACAWYDAASLTHRSRVSTACDGCRTKKIRCTPAASTATCQPCLTSGLPCTRSKAGARTSSKESSPSDSYSKPLSNGLPDFPEQQRLIDAYLSGPHYYCFFNIIHPPTFQQAFQDGSVSQPLLFIVMATSLKSLEPDNALPDTWADRCLRLIMEDVLGPPSTTTLQTLLLLQRYEWHRASHTRAWFLSGMAIRLAHGLQLNVEVADKTRVPAAAREIRRRLMWSCFIMESMIEGGRSPLSGIHVSSIEVRLPCNEAAFAAGCETDMPGLETLLDTEHGLDTLQRPGISAFMVSLTALRRAILEYTLPYHPRNGDGVPSEKPWRQTSPFFEYEAKLGRWEARLPEHLWYTPDNVYNRREQLVTLVTLHCLFHGCYCDLYRIGSYIVASRKSSLHVEKDIDQGSSRAFLARCRRGRLQHAFAICEVISASIKYQPEGHDPVVGISASLALRVLVIERHHEDGVSIGLSDEAIALNIESAVECGKAIARRSAPIRDLFLSVCTLARQNGLRIDLSTIPGSSSLDQQNRTSERAVSPSLRTYGTFGRIQSSLADRRDPAAPAASGSAERESDLFRNYRSADNTQQSETGMYDQQMPMSQPFENQDAWNEVDMGTGWGDGTLSFSMMPSQFDWMNQSLEIDYANYSGFQ